MRKFRFALQRARGERARSKPPATPSVGPDESINGVPVRPPADAGHLATSSLANSAAETALLAGLRNAVEQLDLAVRLMRRAESPDAAKDALIRYGDQHRAIDDTLISLVRPQGAEADDYRGLRHSVETLRESAGVSVIAISSAVAGEGKTTVTLNLAGALAQAPDVRVLVIDADLRHTTVAQRLGIDAQHVGLVDAIANWPRWPSTRRVDATLETVVVRCPHLNLSILPAGSVTPSVYELLASPRLGELLNAARERYDYVLLDTSPLARIPDTRVLARWLDGFLVVVAADRTPRQCLAEALNGLPPSKVLGLLLNGTSMPRNLRSSYVRRAYE